MMGFYLLNFYAIKILRPWSFAFPCLSTHFLMLFSVMRSEIYIVRVRPATETIRAKPCRSILIPPISCLPLVPSDLVSYYVRVQYDVSFFLGYKVFSL